MFATGVLGARNQPAVGAIVFVIGEAMDVAGFHGNDRSCDVTDAREGHQELHSR